MDRFDSAAKTTVAERKIPNQPDIKLVASNTEETPPADDQNPAELSTIYTRSGRRTGEYNCNYGTGWGRLIPLIID